MGFENGSLVRVVLKATNGADQIVNTLHYSLEGGVLTDPPSKQALANRIRDDVLPKYVNAIIPTWTVQPVEVIDEIDPLNPTGLRNAVSSGTPTQGARLAPPASEVLPIEMCGMATLHTAHLGRSFRGRMFLPPVWSDASVDGGKLSGVQYSMYQLLVNSIPLQPDIVTGGGTGTANLCVYSRTRRARSAAQYAEHVTSVTLNDTVHWLRSRGK